MKTAAAILAAVLLQAQDKVALTWNPPAGKVLVARVKATLTGAEPGTFEGEGELHPAAEPAKDGRAYTLKVSRLHSIRGRGKKVSEVLYERGKDLVLKGEAWESSGPFKGIGDDHDVAINPRGTRKTDILNDHIAVTLCLGPVEVALPAGAAGAGSTWESDAHIPFAGPDFIGKLVYTLDSVDKGKTARISFKAAEKESEENFEWKGEGTLVYSFEESLIKELTISLRRARLDGAVLATFEQVLAVSVKP